MQINKESIEECLNKKIAIKFDTVFDNSYGWNNFINFLSFAIKQDNPNAITTDIKKTIGFVNFWHPLTVTLDKLNEIYFPGLKEKNKFLESFINKKSLGNFGAMSLTDSEPTTGKHLDPVTVMYWNCLGSVQWNVFSDSGEQNFILNPGDIILVPADITHEVISLEPRAAISFMFEK